jgi:hypothetical protein
MGEDVSDRLLLNVAGLDSGQSLDESALDRVLEGILASSAGAPSNCFQANI